MSTTFLTDLANATVAGRAIVPQVATSTVTASGVDMQLSDGPVSVVLSIGTVSGTTPTLDFKLQESDTSGGTYTDVIGGSIAQQTAAGLTMVSTNQRTKRWVRALATIAGTTPSFAVSAVILSRKKIIGGAGYVP